MKISYFTGSLLYLLASPRSRATSVPMYQPLKGAAGNFIPPISNCMFETAGMAYHRSPRSLNQSYLMNTCTTSGCEQQRDWQLLTRPHPQCPTSYSGWVRWTWGMRSEGISNNCGSSPFVCSTSGSTSNSVRSLGGDQLKCSRINYMTLYT